MFFARILSLAGAGSFRVGLPSTISPPGNHSRTVTSEMCITTTRLLHAGLHPDASDALRLINLNRARIVQTMSHAAADAGTHAIDGYLDDEAYCAATDFSVYQPTPLSHDAIRELLDDLASVGIAAFFRWHEHDHWAPTDAAHIHGIYAGCAMKSALRTQVHDWCNGRNGLADHAQYTFWQPKSEAIELVCNLFLEHNPRERHHF